MSVVYHCVVFYYVFMHPCFCLWDIQTKRLQTELLRLEARREEAERKSAQTADKVMMLTDVANQVEETRKENDSLLNQVFNQKYITKVL